MHALKHQIARFGLAFGFFWVIVSSVAAEATQHSLDIYLFWAKGCPHCAEETRFMQQEIENMAGVRVHYLEVTGDMGNREAFSASIRHFAIQRPGVPLTVVGERFFEGFDDESTTGAAIKEAIASCLESPCPDIVWPLLTGEEWTEWEQS